MMDTWRVMLDAAATLTPVAIFVIVMAYVVVKSPLEVEIRGTYRLAIRKNGHGIESTGETPPLPPTRESV